MKKKMILATWLFLTGVVILSNHAAFAQMETSSTLFFDGTNYSSLAANKVSKQGKLLNEISLVPDANQPHYASIIKEIEEDQAFVDLNRKYYWKVIENNSDIKNSIGAIASEIIPMAISRLSGNSVSSKDSINQIGTKDYFLQLSKKNNTTGWILLGCGTAMFIGGLIGFGSSYDDSSYTTTDISGFLVLGGLLADAVSIPFFITAHKHKKRAMSLSFGNQNNPFQSVKPNKFYAQAAFTLRVKL
jgi:hypothetical protein